MRYIKLILILCLTICDYLNAQIIDTTFHSGVGFDGNETTDIAIQQDDKILVVGDFSTYNGSF